jgi:hypothetical protein
MNASTKSMDVKVNYMFGADTDDGTKFGIWYGFKDLDHTDAVNNSTIKWIAFPGTDSNAHRGHGWGNPSQRQNIGGMHNRHGKNNQVITIPAKKKMYLKVYGYLHNGSGQYESVGLKSLKIHSPVFK